MPETRDSRRCADLPRMTMEHESDVAYYEAEVRDTRERSLNPAEWPQLDAEIQRLGEVRSLIRSLAATPATTPGETDNE